MVFTYICLLVDENVEKWVSLCQVCARCCKLFFVNASCRSLHSSDDSSNYITVAREYVQNLEYKVEGARLELYKNKEVCM